MFGHDNTKNPVLSGKLEYIRKLRRYFGRDGTAFGGISAGTEEFFEVSRLGQNSAKTAVFDILKNVLLTHNNRDRGGHVRVIG